MLYQHLTYIRNEKVNNVGPWRWPVDDIYAWEGPKYDWENYHYNNILNLCKNKQTVVQAGGCMGVYPRLLSEMFETVYTFEPDPFNFYCLVNNCQRNNIIKINGALGAERNLLQLIIPPEEKHNFGIRYVNLGDPGKRYNNISLPKTTLQFRIDDLSLESCDLIMIDVEENEKDVIFGAMNTIKKFKPIIFAELANNCLDIIKYSGYNIIGHSAKDTIFSAY